MAIPAWDLPFGNLVQNADVTVLERIYAARLARVRAFLKLPEFKTKVSFALHVGVPAATVSHWLMDPPEKNIGEESARKIEEAFGMEPLALDQLDDAASAPSMPPPDPSTRVLFGLRSQIDELNEEGIALIRNSIMTTLAALESGKNELSERRSTPNRKVARTKRSG